MRKITFILVSFLLLLGYGGVVAMGHSSLLEGQLQKLFASSKVPGVSVTIIKDYKIASQYFFGYANEKDKIPVSGDTLFQVGSISKLFTALDIMILEEQGHISLCLPILDVIPQAL